MTLPHGWTGLGLNLPGTANDQTYGFSYTDASQISQRTSTNDLYTWTTPAASKSYTRNGLNQYTAVSGTGFSYDLRGNLTSDGSRTFGYDYENRLTSVSGSASMMLAHDPAGRLQLTVSGGNTVQFLYGGNALQAEYDGAGTLLRRYVHGPGIDEPLVWYEGSGLSDKRYLIADRQGSIIAAEGATTTRYTYGPYGEPDAWAGSRSGMPRVEDMPHRKGGGGGDVEAVETVRHRNTHGAGAGDEVCRQAGAFGAHQEGDARRHPERGQGLGIGARGEGPDFVACRFRGFDQGGAGAAMGEGQPETGAGRDTDGLAVERIAAFFVQQDGRGAEGGSVAETGAHIVVIGEAGEEEGSGVTLRGQNIHRRKRRALQAAGEDAAMHREAGDIVHDALRGNVDRHGIRHEGEKTCQRRKARFAEEQAFDGKARAAQQGFQRDLAFDNEAAAMGAGKVALADRQKSRDPGVAAVCDADEVCGVRRQPAGPVPWRGASSFSATSRRRALRSGGYARG